MTDLNRIQADENLRLRTDAGNYCNNESLLTYSETEDCQRTEDRYDVDPRIVLFGWRLRLATGKFKSVERRLLVTVTFFYIP